MTETHFEVVVNDVGEVTAVVRPWLPFLSDGVRVDGDGIQIYGEGKRRRFVLDDDKRAALTEAGSMLLLELEGRGDSERRENDLLLDER